MQKVASESRSEFFEALEQQFRERLPAERAEQVIAFASHYYATASFDDLAERQPDDIYGATLSTWHFLQQRESLEQPKVRVFNPDFEEHGWQSTHTIVEVLGRDMAFVVDSIRIELNRRNITVHAIHNAVFAVERNEQLELQRLTPPTAAEAPEARESLVYIEIDRHTDGDTLASLADSLREVLGEVRTAVSDVEPMRDQVREAISELREHRPASIEQRDVDEACAFLDWLLDDHFTFLGFEEYRLDESDGQPRLERCENSELGVLGLDLPRYNERPDRLPSMDENSGEYVLVPELVSFAKSAFHARVHRPAYPDYIIVERFDEHGRVIGERRFLGLYTLSVYNETPRNIPVLRRKLASVMHNANVDPKGHNGKQLMQILEVYPRDDLFQTNTDDLCHTAMGILGIRERRRVRVFIREDRSGKFYSCLVFVPRDVFSTDLRVRIQNLLCEELDATFGDFNTYLSESVLARIQLILRFNGDTPVARDDRRIERKVIELARSWRDSLHEAMVEGFGEEPANQLMTHYRDAFPGSYRDEFSPRTAVHDIAYIQKVEAGAPLGISLYRQVENHSDFKLKLFHAGAPIPLSDVLPLLENMGLRVLGERPFEIERSDGTYWIHDFDVAYPGQAGVDLARMRDDFIEAFTRIWTGEAESDTFNRLVIAARLDWHEVAMLRAYARYLKQVRFGLSQQYIADTLTAYPDVTRNLVTLFQQRFNPEEAADDETQRQTREAIEGQLEEVTSLNDDRLIRRYIELIEATLRTNFFQNNEDGTPREYISFKLATRQLSDVPRPRPMYEVFVCSPRMEGVHLRNAKVARGGIRWSDRFEDFRTEILGLVKAQQVKNSVIVPLGAKGGFICKRLPEGGDRDAVQQEGIACYQTLIRGMLDLTDNLVEKEVVAPHDVVRRDEDDPYLVVAADKGTATFSDIANALAHEYRFWLGDAFASGGKHGYDHKAMAITARGAWESVKRHFREIGINTQQDRFTVLGIGDMAGDVFGNGMLLSEKIALVAAFNHRHIFIDPDPDEAASFAERQRVFNLQRSSWSDYDTSVISEGGGVFSRDAKSIAITPQMQQRFGISANRLSPAELIHALLGAEVDLIWNGGIGTYIKSSSESHAEVGDKANDNLRIDGRDLHARVIGEGGNLGVTQLGRREAADHGVRVNTDFIDNAGGVNCSDHEVNIKILLDDVVARGDMTEKQRNELLSQMTDEVAELVIDDNYRQTQALSLSRRLSKDNMGPYRRFVRDLEEIGVLDRELEALPDDQTLAERQRNGEGLTHPELAVLISYAKIDLKSTLGDAELLEDDYIQQHVERAFPATLLERYGDEAYRHRLKSQIVATQLAGDVVDHMGIPFVRRLMDIAGAGSADVVRAYVIARDSFSLPTLWHEIESLDYRIDSDIQYEMMLSLVRLVRRATRHFMRHSGSHGVRDTIEHFASRLNQLQENIGERLRGGAREQWQQLRDRYVEAGVPEQLASRVAATDSLYAGLGIIDTARMTNEKLERVADTYFALGERLQLPWMLDQINRLEVHDSWEAQAREALRDDLDRQQLTLTSSVLRLESAPLEVDERVEHWLEVHRGRIDRWCDLLEEVHSGSQTGYALFTVAVRALGELAESQH
ncbi:glutamate dehydrogenase (NAD) [Kushneria sinocarnis]|uniref:Glutamate dehydrogenase (NAD) n=1 Tax=Kushneria sinocarnis TaxID=595502 RepID=A0A420WTL9_9GAMM|nr:NAD-glutamate dehydrogenase [Kushneria sinocarnis]RKQ96354.1 glutamate dehydrogenase (NAD) [Kushneria sinocarnis]